MLAVLAVVLLIVLPYPWNLAGFLGGLAAFVAELVLWNHTVRGRRTEVGAHTLLGRTAVVVAPCAPDGQVRLDGETWAARCDVQALTGDTVTIVGRDELTLLVERTGPAAA